MLRILPEYVVVAHSAERPVVLAGPPHALTGDVHVTNPGEEHVVIRSAWLRELPLPSSKEVHLPLGAIIRAGQTGLARVTARLDPFTPEGRYQATLVLGDRTFPAELFVTQNIDFDIVPNPLIIENQPGTRIEKQVMFRNRSNFDLKIDSPGAVVEDDDFAVCRILRGGLAQGVESDAHDVDHWVDSVARAAYSNIRESGLLHVRNKEGLTVVPMGESRTVDFEIRIPDSIRPHSRYSAVMLFYNRTLSINVVPSGESRAETPEAGKEPERPRPKRKSRRSRSET